MMFMLKQARNSMLVFRHCSQLIRLQSQLRTKMAKVITAQKLQLLRRQVAIFSLLRATLTKAVKALSSHLLMQAHLICSTCLMA